MKLSTKKFILLILVAVTVGFGSAYFLLRNDEGVVFNPKRTTLLVNGYLQKSKNGLITTTKTNAQDGRSGSMFSCSTSRLGLTIAAYFRELGACIEDIVDETGNDEHCENADILGEEIEGCL